MERVLIGSKSLFDGRVDISGYVVLLIGIIGIILWYKLYILIAKVLFQKRSLLDNSFDKSY